jgi:hypothetical protein
LKTGPLFQLKKVTFWIAFSIGFSIENRRSFLIAIGDPFSIEKVNPIDCEGLWQGRSRPAQITFQLN